VGLLESLLEIDIACTMNIVKCMHLPLDKRSDSLIVALSTQEMIIIPLSGN